MGFIVGNQSSCLFGIHFFEGLEFLPFQLVVVYEKFFQVVHDLLGQVLDGFYFFKDVGTFGDGQEAVVTDRFFAVFPGLFRFDAANDATFDHDARETVEFGNDDHVEGIAIFTLGIRDKAEVIRKDHAGGKYFTHLEEMNGF